MIFSARNIGVHVLGESRRALGVIDVEPQMIRVEVIALENRSRMGAKWLVYDRFNPVRWNDGLLRKPPDIFGGHKLLCDDDDSAARLRLLFIFPTSAMNLRVALVVCNLDMNEGDIRVQRFQEEVLFARKRTLHALNIFCGRSGLQPFQNFGSQQGLDGNERKTQGAG